MKYNPIDVARMFKFVREAATQNTGQRVEGIQKWCGGLSGESWCCYFATLVLDICFQGNAPIPRCGLVQDVYDLAKKKNWLTSRPQLGDLFLYVNAAGHAHHIGFVTSLPVIQGIAGNTSEDGTSSNGNGVYEHAVNTNVFVAYPRAA